MRMGSMSPPRRSLAASSSSALGFGSGSGNRTFGPAPAVSRTGGGGGGGGTAGQRVAMGYRADCEKCVARVPGHYSHILPFGGYQRKRMEEEREREMLREEEEGMGMEW